MVGLGRVRSLGFMPGHQGAMKSFKQVSYITRFILYKKINLVPIEKRSISIFGNMVS